MKVTEKKYGKLLIAVLAVLVMMPGLVAKAKADDSNTLSKKDLKALLATAKTSADHERIAAYYHDQARELTRKSQEFSAQADILAKQPATIESKQGISCQCESHYRYFAKRFAEQAQASEIVAAQHEQAAKEYVAANTPR